MTKIIRIIRLDGVEKTRKDGSLFFGRCLALLLVMLFVLTGAQMGLSLVRDYSRGTVSPRRSPEYGPPSEEKPAPSAGETVLRFVINDGGVGLMAEVKAGQGVPLAASEAARINESLKMGSGLTIGRGSDTGLVFSRGTATALTDLPLLVDLDSNTLTVETSLGIKDVAILPDTAVTRALAAGALTAVDPEQIELVERDDGKIAYRMSGLVGRKLFGLFDIKAEKTVDVSVESGRVLSSLTDSLGATLFNLVAPEIR